MDALSDESGSESGSDVADVADKGGSRVLRDLLARMNLTTMSTSFSGIDSPGTALTQLRVSLQARLGLDPGRNSHTSSHHVHAVEWAQHSQTELLNHPQAPRCLFTNIEEFVKPFLRSQLPDLVDPKKMETILVPLLMSNAVAALKTQRPQAVMLWLPRRTHYYSFFPNLRWGDGCRDVTNCCHCYHS